MIRNFFALVVCTSLLTLVGCDKDDDNDTPDPSKNITQIVVDDAKFSLLEAAVVRAGLSNTLSTTPNLTVFAPDNDAFAASGIDEAAINSLPVEMLAAILSNHVLGSEVTSANVPAGPNAAVTALGEETLYVTKNSSGVYVNGIKVKTADIDASNGVIHVVSKVILPPAGNIVETAAANPDLTYLVAAVVRADASGTSISGALAGAGPLTVFAPTNQAFINAGFATIADIQAADPNALKDILLNHVIAARVFSSDLTEDGDPETVGGGTLDISLNGGAKVKGASNTSAAAITNTDIVAENGVIHLVDQVLLP